MIPIGINWKAVWKPVWKTVWKQGGPVPPISVGGGGWKQDEEERLYRERIRIERQNIDDMEVIRILTEFLSRN